jgi:hypothetical protein
MEASPRPVLEVDGLERYEDTTRARNIRVASFFKWSQRDRVLLRLFRTLQFKRLAASRKFRRADLPSELKDPDPYEPEYVFFCMRLKGCSV